VLMVVVVAGMSQPALDNNMIKEINSMPGRTWTAQRNSIFENKTLDDLRRMMGVKFPENPPNRPMPPWREEDLEKLADGVPASFDWRSADPACIHPIRNQGNCGSCWAFGASEALSDRFCLWSKNSINVVLSPQQLVSCDHNSGDGGCAGGELITAWDFMVSVGLVTDACFPYFAQDVACPSSCYNGQTPTFYHSENAYTVGNPNTPAEIYTHGPVEAAFIVYQDFVHYGGGVYQHTSGGELGGHAIKMLGWGVSGGVPYWLCANSWGTGWGPYGGFFLIRRGVNECGIEGSVTAGYPRV